MENDGLDGIVVAYATSDGNWVCIECAEQWQPADGAIEPVTLADDARMRWNFTRNVSDHDTCSVCDQDLLVVFDARYGPDSIWHGWTPTA